jgi:hypothetical protein
VLTLPTIAGRRLPRGDVGHGDVAPVLPDFVEDGQEGWRVGCKWFAYLANALAAAA